MVDVLEVRAALERELEWRIAEIRSFRNHAADLSEEERARFMRAVLLLLYAHYEGFCKAALLEYVRAINSAGISCGDAMPAVVAGAWAKVFVALGGDQKARVFKTVLPDDSTLHALARRREFVERLEELREGGVQFPEEVIDTDSNLWPRQLRRNLYLVGLKPEWVDEHEGSVMRLLYLRNGIAHGAERNGIAAEKYSALEATVFKVMDSLMLEVVEAIRQRSYLRETA